MSLLSLPCDLIKEIIGEWLQVHEWTLLDSSIDKQHRSIVLECFESIQFQSGVHVNRFIKTGPSYYQWISTRRIKLDIIRVFDDVHDNLWLVDFSEVKVVEISENNDDTVVRLVNRCRKLSEMELTDIRPGKSTESFDYNILDGMTSISLNSTILQFHTLTAIACQTTSLKHFKNLRSCWAQDFEATLLANNQKTLCTYFSTAKLFNPTLVFSRINSDCLSLEAVNLRCATFPVGFISAFFNRHSTVNQLLITGDRSKFKYKNISANEKVLEIEHLAATDLVDLACVAPSGLSQIDLNSVRFTDTLFQSLLGRSYQELRYLTITHSFESLTAVTLHDVLSNATILSSLAINGCKYSSEDLQLVLCPAISSWRWVQLGICSHLTEDTVLSLLSSGPDLVQLTVFGCPNVTKQLCNQANRSVLSIT